jgi:hypothetical protein
MEINENSLFVKDKNYSEYCLDRIESDWFLFVKKSDLDDAELATEPLKNSIYSDAHISVSPLIEIANVFCMAFMVHKLRKMAESQETIVYFTFFMLFFLIEQILKISSYYLINKFCMIFKNAMTILYFYLLTCIWMSLRKEVTRKIYKFLITILAFETLFLLICFTNAGIGKISSKQKLLS